MTFLRENSGSIKEAVGNGGSTWRIRVISAGAGSSAYYPAEVLERDGKLAFPIGTKAYLNHPSAEEGWDRPERDVEKICAKQVSEVEYDATDQSLYADFTFGRDYTVFVEDFHDVIGMSIYAYAEFEFGTIGEYSGDIVSHLLPSKENSVDVVTVAGANGAIISRVSESLKRLGEKGTAAPAGAAATPPTEGSSMELKDVQEAIAAANKQLVTDLVAALAPAPTVQESDTEAELELVAESGLPKEARAVAYKAVREGAPAAEAIAGQKALVESIKTSLTEEAAASAANGRPLTESDKESDYTVARWKA